MENPDKISIPGVLTGIPDAYTLGATNEVEAMYIEDFIKTLAEVALAIATRQITHGEINP